MADEYNRVPWADEYNRVPWEIDQTFEANTVVVQVSVLKLHRPRYSISIGRRLGDTPGPTNDRAIEERNTARANDIGRFFPVSTSGQGRIEVHTTLDTATLVRLIEQAHAYVAKRLQEHEDWRIDGMQERETRHAPREAKANRGLKELSKHDAHKGGTK